MTHRTVRNRDITNPTCDIMRDTGLLLIALALLIAVSGIIGGWHVFVVLGTYLIPSLAGTKLVKRSKRISK